ncbi:MAG: hypothetical protein ABEJ56_04975, partial [Candidatus Nanohaloarchaea archaeon]
MEDDISRQERENLHKWGKARRIIDEEKIQLELQSDDRYQFKIQGDSKTYNVGVDIDTGESFCPCDFHGKNCSHQISAHLFLAGIGVEKDWYRQND